MAQETAKIKLSNEEDTLESIAIAFGSPMVSEEFRAEVGHILEKSEKYHEIFTLSDYPTSTGKLSVDKLEEYLVAYDEESIQKIRDEKIQLVTANEFFGLHQEKLANERKSFRPLPIYIIPSNIAKILDEAEVTDVDFDIPKEVINWVNELKDDYINWSGRMFLVLAYCNPLTSPKAFPNIWKVE